MQKSIPGAAAALGSSPSDMQFWIFASATAPEKNGLHIAFQANSHEEVSKFHEEGIKAGGKDNGAPGPRKYSANYYAAFVLDPLG